MQNKKIERWPSGLRRTLGKRVYGNVSRVRIPSSLQGYIQQKNLCVFNNKDKGLKKVFALIIGTEIDVVYIE